MLHRPLATVALLVVLAACTRAEPPDPVIGFGAASAHPLSASYRELVTDGARVLDAEAVRSVVGLMGEDAFLQAIGGRAEDELVLRADGAACTGGTADADCRRIVADGMRFRVFDFAGAPLGTLGPSAG